MTPAQCRAARGLVNMSMVQLAAAAVVPILVIYDFEGAGESRNPRGWVEAPPAEPAWWRNESLPIQPATPDEPPRLPGRADVRQQDLFGSAISPTRRRRFKLCDGGRAILQTSGGSPTLSLNDWIFSRLRGQIFFTRFTHQFLHPLKRG